MPKSVSQTGRNQLNRILDEAYSSDVKISLIQVSLSIESNQFQADDYNYIIEQAIQLALLDSNYLNLIRYIADQLPQFLRVYKQETTVKLFNIFIEQANPAIWQHSEIENLFVYACNYFNLKELARFDCEKLGYLFSQLQKINDLIQSRNSKYLSKAYRELVNDVVSVLSEKLKSADSEIISSTVFLVAKFGALIPDEVIDELMTTAFQEVMDKNLSPKEIAWILDSCVTFDFSLENKTFADFFHRSLMSLQSNEAMFKCSPLSALYIVSTLAYYYPSLGKESRYYDLALSLLQRTYHSSQNPSIQERSALKKMINCILNWQLPLSGEPVYSAVLEIFYEHFKQNIQVEDVPYFLHKIDNACKYHGTQISNNKEVKFFIGNLRACLINKVGIGLEDVQISLAEQINFVFLFRNYKHHRDVIQTVIKPILANLYLNADRLSSNEKFKILNALCHYSLEMDWKIDEEIGCKLYDFFVKMLSEVDLSEKLDIHILATLLHFLAAFHMEDYFPKNEIMHQVAMLSKTAIQCSSKVFVQLQQFRLAAKMLDLVFPKWIEYQIKAISLKPDVIESYSQEKIFKSLQMMSELSECEFFYEKYVEIYPVDILLINAKGDKLVIQVDGMSHYGLPNDHSLEVVSNHSTKLRDRIVGKSGQQEILIIPVSEWKKSPSTYVQNKIKSTKFYSKTIVASPLKDEMSTFQGGASKNKQIPKVNYYGTSRQSANKSEFWYKDDKKSQANSRQRNNNNNANTNSQANVKEEMPGKSPG